MTAVEINPGLHGGDVSIGPPRRRTVAERESTPRLTPVEWARRRRVEKEQRRLETVRNRTKGRLNKLGPEWHLIDASSMGLGKRDAFVAIGPGGIFAVTVKSQGRDRVRISGDVIQISGARPPYIAEARTFANVLGGAFTRTAGVQVPVTPVLALAGTGLITLFGVPKGCVVMPYRELASLLGAYGERIGSNTVEKLASIARHPATTIDLRSDELSERYGWT
jgi:hypothetical protein